MVFIGADHRGYRLKNFLVEFLRSQNYQVEDVGAYSLDPDDDYPIYAEKVALKAARKDNFGILICGSGHGVCIAANKVSGVRAILADTIESANLGRVDDDANVLCLHSDRYDSWKIRKVVKTFLGTPFEPEPRFVRRIEEIKEIEKRN